MGVSANKLGRYELRREIARSNDVVYEAWDPTVNRRVAVKELVMPPGLHGTAMDERIQRFYREARAAGQLQHSNIVTIFEVGEDVGRHFIAMEYLEGPTLREAMQGSQGMPVERAVKIAAQVADALAYAHSHGVVHRDVKPDNVHIVGEDLPKLTDFGIARIEAETNITLSGQVFGTPSYMSPEQVAGGAIDARTDVFSLGVMLFEMVAGRKPFQGDSVVTITYNIVHEAAAMPAHVPEHLAGILRRAMAKNPAERYQNAAEMAAALRAARSTPLIFGGAPDPGAWRVPPGATMQPMQGTLAAPYFAAAPRRRLRLPRLPRFNPSPEARVFLGALTASLVVGGILAWGVWVASVRHKEQQHVQAVSRVGETIRAAVQAFDRHDYRAAVEGFREAYGNTSDPELRERLRYNLVNTYIAYGVSRGSTAERLQAFQYAEMTDPASALPKYYLGAVYHEMGNKEAAVRYFEDVIAMADSAPREANMARPRLARIYLDLAGIASANQGLNGKSARDYWEMAANVAPLSPAGEAAQALLRGESPNPDFGP